MTDGITDIRLTEDSARRELLELSIAAAGVGTFDWNLVTKKLVWDDRLIELFGYEKGSFDESIEAFNARLHEDDLQRVTQNLEEAISTCGEYRSEYRICLPDGEVRWVAAKGRALADEHGKATRLLGAAWDITWRAHGEARIARSLESMSTPFFSLDAEWRFTYLNGAAERVLGSPREQLLGGVIWELFPAAVGSNFETNYRRAAAQSTSLAFDAYYPAPLDSWYEVRVWPNADGLDVYFIDITNNRRAREQSETAARRAELLARITNDLAATLDFDTAAEALSELVVPTLAQWCIVTLVSDELHAGSHLGLRNAAAHHEDPKMQATVMEYANARIDALTDDGPVVAIMNNSRSEMVIDDAMNNAINMIKPGPVRTLFETLAPDSVVILPLKGRSGAVGMITLVNGKSRGPFTEDDLITARHIAGRAGLLLDNARLYRQQRELAEGLQRSLLTEPAQPNDLQIAVRYAPAAETAQVGGDWYDAFVQSSGETVVVVGDVVGHDTEAAAAMGHMRSVVRALGAVGDDSPAAILQNVDSVVATLQVATTATAVLAKFETVNDSAMASGRRVSISNAGHPPPIHLSADGVPTIIDGSNNLLIGVDAAFERTEQHVVIQPGETLLFYTDGLIERRGQSLDDGLRSLCNHLRTQHLVDIEVLCDNLLEAMLPRDATDDVAMLAVRVR